ncbi:MAG: hypothetical protein J6B01_04460 [Ruminococcus sp.]|nr:hypothetical protein [Ruminococcus sp.]
MDAVKKGFNGCIFNGGVGSGKSRTGLFYWFKECGGWIDEYGYQPMTKPKELYIITTAMKRNSLEWEGELANFFLSTDSTKNDLNMRVKITIDSWNSIKKYADISNCFFIFDEAKNTGSGVWAKTFIKIAKKNDWILLSATVADTWEQYAPIFIAHGFYKNKTEFNSEHCVYSRFTKYPKVERYINEGRLIRLRNKLLIEMNFERKTARHDEDVYVEFDRAKYKEVIRNRWNPFENKPIEQAAEFCQVLRRIVNTDESRVVALLEILEKHPRAIIFYNNNYELELLKHIFWDVEGLEDTSPNGFEVAEYNGHAHMPIPTGDRWVYLVQYNGCEGWNAITTDTIIFFSQNYSYRILEQARGRIDRLTTPFTDLWYYHLKSRSSIDLAISKSLKKKGQFNERKFARWD